MSRQCLSLVTAACALALGQAFAADCFLFDGEMRSPGRLTCAAAKADFLIRGTYAREGEYRVCTRTNLASVVHSLWRAPDGHLAAVLCNWTRKPQAFALDAPDLKASGELAPRSWKLVAKGEP